MNSLSSNMYDNVGLLGPPPGLLVHELNSTTLYLSWNAPSTLRGIPISNYSVDIDNLVMVSTVTVFASVNQPSIDPNMTSLDLSQVGSIGYLYNPSCESLRFSVRAWNSVGEGASSIVLYTQGKQKIILYPTYDIDQRYRQRYIILYCPVPGLVGRVDFNASYATL